MTVSTVPEWFWDLLEASRPSLQRLEDWLGRAEPERIVEFARAWRDASEAIADATNGPTVDGERLSEDDTEDFCHWVVSQGRETWQTALPPAALEDFVRRYRGGDGTWDPDFRDSRRAARSSSPRTLAFVVFRERFDDELSDYLSDD